MEKRKFTIRDKAISVDIPVENIDEESRIVSGWATIDNVDQTGDVVLADASLKAFSQFRGNIREMHDSHKAVGKLLSFEQREYYNDEDGQMYTGIWVRVYISKGAEDTWQKILDGTLSGFSIGGMVPEGGMVQQYVPDLGKTVTFVTEYMLIELTLADSPANELCDIVTIHKALDGKTTITGLIAETEVENVFWCETDRVAMVTKTDSLDCAACSNGMEQVGWVEQSDDVAAEIRKVLESSNKISKINATEGGQDNMPENENNEVAEVEAVVEETAQTEEVEAKAEETEGKEETTEVEVEANAEVEAVSEPTLGDITSALSQIQETLAAATGKDQERELALSKVRETVEGVEAKFEKTLSDLQEKHEKLAADLSALKEGVTAVEKRLDGVEGSTALKKSADVAGEGLNKPAPVRKTLWSGALLPDSFDQD